MAKPLQIKLNSRVARAILQSPAVLADLRRRGEAIARSADAHVEGEIGPNRARVAVIGDPDKLAASLDAGRH